MKQIIIRTESLEAMIETRESLHQQLKGNKDYIDSRIVLNDSDDRCDGTTFEVHVDILPESGSNPKLII